MSRFSATERFPLFVSFTPFIGPDPIIRGRPDSFSLVWRLFSSVGGDGVVEQWPGVSALSRDKLRLLPESRCTKKTPQKSRSGLPEKSSFF
jgi:hypothetical protein